MVGLKMALTEVQAARPGLNTHDWRRMALWVKVSVFHL